MLGLIDLYQVRNQFLNAILKFFMADNRKPLCGADLERWRLANGLTKASAADAFGLRLVKWNQLTDTKSAHQQIEDPTVALLLELYTTVPASSPVSQVVDMNEFYSFLGFEDDPRDREMFAALIGRSVPSAYRLLLHGGNPARQLNCLVVALMRLGLTPESTRALMSKVAREVGEKQGRSNVLENGWRAADD